MQPNLLIIQGGGPTAVFNASLAAIIQEQQRLVPGGHIFGARFGMQGLATDDLIALEGLSSYALASMRQAPGAALGSSRFAPDPQQLDACLRVLRQRDIRQVIFLGGNGTMTGAQKFSDFCRSCNYELQVMGSPKTIDNDICATDRCPGFASAARFVAQSTLDLAADLRSLHQPVSIFETLGRDVGWLAAASTLAKQGPDDAPHVVCVPEVPFELDRFLGTIEDTVARLGWASAVVSEGTAYADGTPVFVQHLASSGEAPLRPLIGGVAQHLSGLVAQQLGLRCRSEKPGLIGRSSSMHISQLDLLDAEQTGRACVAALTSGETDQMSSLLPWDGISPTPQATTIPLSAASGRRRRIPDEWLGDTAILVNSQFRTYAEPLVGRLQSHFNLG